MSTVREQIFQGIREWIIKVNSLSTSGDVIHSQEDGPRPAKPYVEVKVRKANQPVFDEHIPGEKNNNASHKTHAGRVANVTAQGYGAETDDWLEKAQLSLKNPKIRDFLGDNHGLTIRRLPNGIDDVTELVDTDFEPRFVIEFQAAYRLVTDEVETYVGANHLDMDLALDDPMKDDTLNADFVVDF
ncbi:MAG: LIC_12616 family protein [Bradymonadaceae bacterium]